MKIAMLIVDDPVLLPRFLKTYSSVRSKDTIVYIVKPLYKSESSFTAGIKYFKTFGFFSALNLAGRIALCKLKDLSNHRGMKSNSIKKICEYFKMPYEYVENLNDTKFLEKLRLQNIDVIVSVSVPQIFGEELISVPKKACLNLHGSILPDYRGVMPSFWVLAKGEKKTGVSIFQVTKGIDTGPLLGQTIYNIPEKISQHELLVLSKAHACNLLLDVLTQLEEGRHSLTAFDPSKGRYFSWPKKGDVKQLYRNGHSIW